MPRTDATYTWGVIELNDRDYSVDESWATTTTTVTGFEPRASPGTR